jgi:hypothetical protein
MNTNFNLSVVNSLMAVSENLGKIMYQRHQQLYGVDYFETFSPVVSRTTVRFLPVFSLMLGLDTKKWTEFVIFSFSSC